MTLKQTLSLFWLFCTKFLPVGDFIGTDMNGFPRTAEHFLMGSQRIAGWSKNVMFNMIHPHTDTVLGHFAPPGQRRKYEDTGELGLTVI